MTQAEPDTLDGHSEPETPSLFPSQNPSQAPQRYKLPKKARMPAGRPYQRVFQRRQSVSDENVTVHVFVNEMSHHRLGFAVGKKMLRRAVDRNYMKRLIREAFRLERPGFQGGLDLVIRPRLKTLTLEQLRVSLRKLVPKAEKRYLPAEPSSVGKIPDANPLPTPPEKEVGQ